MDFVAPVGSSDPTSWVNGDRATGVKGSRVPHQAFTDSNAEVVNAIIAGGKVPDSNDLTQLSQVMFPGPADPPIAPNLPQAVYTADGLQTFAHGVPTNVTYATLIKNNLIDSIFDGVTLTIGAQDAGLFAVTCGIDFSGAGGASGVDFFIYTSGAVGLARDNRTASTASNLGTTLTYVDRFVAGSEIYTTASWGAWVGSGSNTPTANLSRFTATKLSV